MGQREKRCDRGRRLGFTLVEVLVTVAVVAVGLVLVLEALSTCLASLGVARDHLRAASLLRSHLAEYEVTPGASAVRRGSFDGVCSDYDWEVRESPVSPRCGSLGPSNVLARVDLAIRNRRSGTEVSVCTCLFR
jgi:prepilin-type N-terminal cleavage/methylation domain-containing protein